MIFKSVNVFVAVHDNPKYLRFEHGNAQLYSTVIKCELVTCDIRRIYR